MSYISIANHNQIFYFATTCLGRNGSSSKNGVYQGLQQQNM